VLVLVIPLEGERVGVAVDGIGDSYGLMQVRGNSFEGRELGLGHCAGGFAVVQIGAVGVGVEVAHAGDCAGVGGAGGVLGVLRGVAFERGAVGVVGTGGCVACGGVSVGS